MQNLEFGGGGTQRCVVNPLPPPPGEALPPDSSTQEPEGDFALNGYLRLLELQNQALRKLAAGLDLPPVPATPDTRSGPSDQPV